MTDIPTSMCYYAVVIIYKIELYTKDNTIMNNIVINSKVAKEGEESWKKINKLLKCNIITYSIF